ncbi:ribonuclease P protein component [Candidatus Peregrinibacteria bacterium]|nr:ribonuclease P protein component [Candidatus Peregrinibacteria bacterium]
MLSRKSRILNQRLIAKLNKEGPSYKTSHFVFKFLPSISEDSKFAVSISKQFSRKAVSRNRIRRQITESIRLNMSILKNPIVCLVTTKKGIPEDLEYCVIESQIKEFFNHAHINV